MSEQDTAPAVYNIVAFCFDGRKTAKQILKEAKKRASHEGYKTVAQAIFEKNKKGKVSVKEPGKGGVGATVGAVGGGLLGLIGGPAGLLAWTVGGAVIAGIAGNHLGRPISKGDLKELGQALATDSSAVLMLLEDTWSEDAIDSMSGYNADVVTLTVGDELSGHIAEYVASTISDE